jgi:curved DNA-binding protein CbpA
MALTDPYKVLGIPHSASDGEIRAAYRRQVQLHHPDHNAGSAESARRFEEVQQAYALIRKLDRDGGRSARPAGSPSQAPPPDPGLEQRLAEMERDLAAQRAAKAEAARRAEQIRSDALRQAREAARADADRPADEDLGYVTTDDSFSAIFDDTIDAWSKRFAESGPSERPGRDATPESDPEPAGERRHEPVNERLADLFDDLGSRLRGDKRRRDES